MAISKSYTPDLVLYSSPSVATVTCYKYSDATPYKKPILLGGDYVGAIVFSTGVGISMAQNHFESFTVSFASFMPNETLSPLTVALAPWSVGGTPHKITPSLVVSPQTVIVKRTSGATTVISNFSKNALGWLRENGNKPFCLLLYGSPDVTCSASFTKPSASSSYDAGVGDGVKCPVMMRVDGGWIRRQGFVKQATANRWKEIVRCKEGR